MKQSILEKLIVAKLFKKFPAFYGTRKFITVFTKAHHVSLSIYLWLYSHLLDLGSFFSFLILYTVGRLLGRGISPSQGLCVHAEQHKHRINTHRHPCLEWDSNP
jgi:hypothetical protein